MTWARGLNQHFNQSGVGANSGSNPSLGRVSGDQLSAAPKPTADIAHFGANSPGSSPPGLSPEWVRARLRVRDCLDSFESRELRCPWVYDRDVLMLMVGAPYCQHTVSSRKGRESTLLRRQVYSMSVSWGWAGPPQIGHTSGTLAQAVPRTSRIDRDQKVSLREMWEGRLPLKWLGRRAASRSPASPETTGQK